jgi:hypothetical protein
MKDLSIRSLVTLSVPPPVDIFFALVAVTSIGLLTLLGALWHLLLQRPGLQAVGKLSRYSRVEDRKRCIIAARIVDRCNVLQHNISN